MMELKQLEQGSWTMNKFVQIFRRVVKRSRYKKRALVEEFEKGISSNIRYKLIEVEWSSLDIKE